MDREKLESLKIVSVKYVKEAGMESLSVVLVWNESDGSKVEKYIQYVTKWLSRDINKPFSRAINLPIFYYSNFEEDGVPPLPKVEAERIVIYVFIGINSVSSDKWRSYIESLYDIKNAKIVPIALDEYAYKVGDKVQLYNFIREYELEVCREQQLFISMAHEIYRFGFNEKKDGISTNSALKIFLSHAKEGKDGLNIAKQLKELVDNSTMRRFFDSNDIAPGYRFDDEIINNIKESSVIIINSDIYSSRYWCQREIQIAKEYERPIIEVDLIAKAMDRKFPFAGNVPVVRVNTINGEIEINDLYRILENIMIETIRFNYVDKKLEAFKRKISGKIKKMCRPPEMIDLPKIIKKEENIVVDYNKIIYPDPPIYSEEIDFFRKLGIEIFTPMEYGKDKLHGKKVGISISDPVIHELKSNGLNESHLLRLSQYVANYVLSRGAILIYGGDLRKDGYTAQLLQEAQVLKDRLKTRDIYLKNYLAWPIYLADTLELKKWKAKYSGLLEMKEIQFDETVYKFVKTDKKFIPPNTIDNWYVWSKSLTKMRYKMIEDCDARICAGGKKVGYKGKMPGVLEEILIASELGCPLYLLGGFGGVVHDICELLQNKKSLDSLTGSRQESYNMGYRELLQRYEEQGEKIDYLEIQRKLRSINLNNGLTEEENRVLFNTVYVDEAVQLILKGLQMI